MAALMANNCLLTDKQLYAHYQNGFHSLMKKRENSLSKFGVNTSLPMAARISSIVQKRPPASSSADGDIVPSYTVRLTYTSSRSFLLSNTYLPMLTGVKSSMPSSSRTS